MRSAMRSVSFIVLALIVLTVFSGCGVKKASVSGKVTFEGKPLAHHIVSFELIGADNASNLITTGKTDDEGRFTLTELGSGLSRCPVGKCRVRIIWDNPAKREPGSEDVPVYNPPVTLPPSTRDGSMTFDVPSQGTDNANFDL